MRTIITWAVWSCLTVLLVHALAFSLMVVLPDAASLALGLFAADESVLSAVRQAYQSKGYIETLSSIVSGDFGQTVDGTQVSSAVVVALQESVPRLLIAVACMAAAVAAGLVYAPSKQKGATRVLEFLTAIPSFVVAFFAYAIFATVSPGLESTTELALRQALVVGAMATPVAALTYLQTSNIVEQSLTRPFALTPLAAGASLSQLRLAMLPNVVVQLGPSLEKGVVLLLSTTLFAEPILGVSGIGATAIRALTRGDINLVLATVMVFSLVIIAARLLTSISRASFRVDVP